MTLGLVLTMAGGGLAGWCLSCRNWPGVGIGAAMFSLGLIIP